MYDQADCFTKNFGDRSRRPITKKLRNRPIMFGFSHCLVYRVQCLGKISLGWLVLLKGQFYILLLSFLKFDIQTWWNNCYEANITYSTNWHINLSKWRPIRLRHRCGLLDGLTHPNLCSKGCLSLFNYFIYTSPALMSPFFVKITWFWREKMYFFHKKWPH